VNGQPLTDKRAMRHQWGNLLILQHGGVDVEREVQGIETNAVSATAMPSGASAASRCMPSVVVPEPV
jgi:hypothetical protein